jgi:hypothetical protein
MIYFLAALLVGLFGFVVGREAHRRDRATLPLPG